MLQCFILLTLWSVLLFALELYPCRVFNGIGYLVVDVRIAPGSHILLGQRSLLWPWEAPFSLQHIVGAEKN